MTQAFNLSQLANNLNTAGQLDATDGLVNAVPVANGGTGVSTLSGVAYGNGTSAFTAATNAQMRSALGTLTVGGGGTGVTTLTGLAYGNGTSAFTAATGSQVAAALGTTPVSSAGKIATTNFTIEEVSGKLVFKYGATTIASMDSTGLFTSAANITAGGTP